MIEQVPPVFVDTGAFFASAVPADKDFAAAQKWLTENTRPLLTTDYIIDETLTLLRARGESTRALSMGEGLFGGTDVNVCYLSEYDVREAWVVFRQFKDKSWSFTDCPSKVIIEKFGISEAFAFDRHFRQFGTVKVVPGLA